MNLNTTTSITSVRYDMWVRLVKQEKEAVRTMALRAKLLLVENTPNHMTVHAHLNPVAFCDLQAWQARVEGKVLILRQRPMRKRVIDQLIRDAFEMID